MRKLGVLFSFLFICLVFEMCKMHKNELSQDEIVLKWHQSYNTETKRDIEIGLQWIFLYLGASCTEINMQHGLSWVDNRVFELKIDQLGFEMESLNVLRSLLNELKQSPEYKKHQCLDVGLFVMNIYNKSENYYKITQVPRTQSEFVTSHNFDDRFEFVTAYGESCVSSGIRLFNVAQSKQLTEIAYWAKEGTGETVENFQVKEFEVFDFMSNGQPRFAIYDLDGSLKNGADSEVSIGGKPAKCMWCHTSSVQPIISAASSIEGFERLDSFSRLIKKQNNIRKRYLRNQSYDFVVDSLSQHSLAELLYFTYEYPTPQRLISEGISRSEVEKLEYHKNIEYKFFDLVFDSMVHRHEIDPTFKMSARETVWTPE